MVSQDLGLPFPEPFLPRSQTRWFSPRGCVVIDEGRVQVFVGGSLVGAFDRDDRPARDALILILSDSDGRRLGALARAFEISPELLRQLRAMRKAEGLQAVINRPKPGAPKKLTPQLRAKMEKLFDDGATIAYARAQLAKRGNNLSMALVARVHHEWYLRLLARIRQPAPAPSTNAADGEARSLGGATSRLGVQTLDVRPDTRHGRQQTEFIFGEPQHLPEREVTVESCDEDVTATEAQSNGASPCDRTADAKAAADLPCQAPGEDVPQTSRAHIVAAVQPAKGMQHAGVWIMLGLLHTWGFYEIAVRAVSKNRRVASSALRLVVDLVVAALTIHQRCVEGVRRLATPTAWLLLRARRTPSTTWVRATVGRIAGDGGALSFHIGVADHFIREGTQAASSDQPAVFYVDGHMRPYTGQETIRKGWRMQDRRARPGTTDIYVHDEDGRPLMRMDDPQHEHLTLWVPELALVLRAGLDPDERILVAFDRGGAFPEHLAGLRDDGVDFVTYERAPLRRLRRGAFTEKFADGEEWILVSDSRANLGNGRGRVRRIALLMPDGKQVNLLAVSKLSPEVLYRIMRSRWVQENGFKHGNERWGINQLDGRTTVAVPPDTKIPNPARRRLDRAIKIARQAEGKLRCKLSALDVDHPQRAKVEAALGEAVQRVLDLIANRPSTPTHARLEDTDLAEKLVQHPGDYKMWIDTMRIACANTESELAEILALRLPRPAEAKMVLANIFAAPGDVTISRGRATVTLAPAAISAEVDAIRGFLAEVTAMNLTLPGDARGLKLTFRLQEY